MLQRALLLNTSVPIHKRVGASPYQGGGGLPYHFLAPARPPARLTSIPSSDNPVEFAVLFSSSKEGGCVCYTGAPWAVARLRADAYIDTLRVYGCHKRYTYLGKRSKQHR